MRIQLTGLFLTVMVLGANCGQFMNFNRQATMQSHSEKLSNLLQTEDSEYVIDQVLNVLKQLQHEAVKSLK